VDIAAISNVSGDLLGTVIDSVLLLGFVLLWFSWYRNGKRQQHLEKLLIETAGQLDQASRHLEATTHLIEQLKAEQSRNGSVPDRLLSDRMVSNRAAVPASTPTATSSNPTAAAPNRSELNRSELNRSDPKRSDPNRCDYNQPKLNPSGFNPYRSNKHGHTQDTRLSSVEPTSQPPKSSTQATMILRMQREGEHPESIADRLDLPLAQVKLLLKLNASAPHTSDEE